MNPVRQISIHVSGVCRLNNNFIIINSRPAMRKTNGKQGCLEPTNGIGVRACDPEAYHVFDDLLTPMILCYHGVSSLSHPRVEYGISSILNIPDIDPSGEFIISTRVRVGRSHEGYGFHPVIGKQEREEVEYKSKTALATLSGDLKGKYYPLSELTEQQIQELSKGHHLFALKDRLLLAGGAHEDWPHNRGIFLNEDRTFVVWVNEEDHLRLISMEYGGNIGRVYSRLIHALEQLERHLHFTWRKGYGYITFCPTNLGTSLRASVLIKLPHLSQQPDFQSFLHKHNLQARGTNGYGSNVIDSLYDISNKHRLGLTEHAAVLEMVSGVRACIEEERKLSHQFEITVDIPQ